MLQNKILLKIKENINLSILSDSLEGFPDFNNGGGDQRCRRIESGGTTTSELKLEGEGNGVDIVDVVSASSVREIWKFIFTDQILPQNRSKLTNSAGERSNGVSGSVDGRNGGTGRLSNGVQFSSIRGKIGCVSVRVGQVLQQKKNENLEG
jgi:hypothetical protein